MEEAERKAKERRSRQERKITVAEEKTEDWYAKKAVELVDNSVQNAAGQSARAKEAEGEYNKACRHLEKSQAAYLEASQTWQMPCRRLFSMERKLRRTGCTSSSSSGPLDQEPRKFRRDPCYQGQGLVERKPKEESASLPKEESASLLKRPNEKNGESAPTRMNGRLEELSGQTRSFHLQSMSLSVENGAKDWEKPYGTWLTEDSGKTNTATLCHSVLSRGSPRAQQNTTKPRATWKQSMLCDLCRRPEMRKDEEKRWTSGTSIRLHPVGRGRADRW